MQQEHSLKFIGKSQVAERYGVNIKTLGVWLDKIKNKIPLYRDKQRYFSPAQVKFLDRIFTVGESDPQSEVA